MNTSADTTAAAASQHRNDTSWRLVMLGYLLQALHVLFAITAIIGMLIAHTRGARVQDATARSHIRSQLLTFWLALPLYLLAFWWWARSGNWWPLIAVLMLVYLRVLRGWWQMLRQQPVTLFW